MLLAVSVIYKGKIYLMILYQIIISQIQYERCQSLCHQMLITK